MRLGIWFRRSGFGPRVMSLELTSLGLRCAVNECHGSLGLHVLGCMQKELLYLMIAICAFHMVINDNPKLTLGVLRFLGFCPSPL